MNHLYKNTPFDQFQESWLSELNEEFLAWLDHVALYVSQKKESTDPFCGYGSPDHNEFYMFSKICQVAALDLCIVRRRNLLISIAQRINKTKKEPVNAWLGFLHALLREHDDAAQTKKVIEAIYRTNSVYCKKG